MILSRPVLICLVAVVALFVAISAIRSTVSGDERTLTYRIESFNIGLDPAAITDTQSRRIVDMLHAGLLSLDPDGEVSGELAEHWEWTNSDTLRLTLRTGMTFSNGTTVTAEDAAWSLCRLLQPTAPYNWLFSNVKHIEENGAVRCSGISVVDPMTLEIAVNADPDRLIPALASSSAAVIPRGSQPGEYGAMPGAGPFALDRIVLNSRVVLKARAGGPLKPGAPRVVFQLIQDDATAVGLFKAGALDVIEIANPTLYRLLVNSDGTRTFDGRLYGKDVHQVRLLIFNETKIARELGLDSGDIQAWIQGFRANVDLSTLVATFDPLAVELHTSYFPARNVQISSGGGVPLDTAGELVIITENDPYSDAIVAQLPQQVGGTSIDYIGIEKSVLVSRLLKHDFDIAAITLEAMIAHPSYWLSFFAPGSPFTVFGKSLDGIDMSRNDDLSDKVENARIIDTKGNWLLLFQERRWYAFQPHVAGESYLATGLINYATIRITP